MRGLCAAFTNFGAAAASPHLFGFPSFLCCLLDGRRGRAPDEYLGSFKNPLYSQRPAGLPSGVRPTGIERCGRILAVRDRNSSILRDQSHSRLNSYVEVVSERTNNGAIPFPSPPWLRKDWPPLPPQNLSSIHTDRSSADDGSRVKPPRALQPLNGALPRKFAHSERFALPRMTAPAARNTIHHHGIRRNDAPTSASDPAVVCILSAVARLSFTRIGKSL